MLFAEISEGWIAAIFAGIVAVVGAAATTWQTIRKSRSDSAKEEAEREQARLAYLFGQYESLVENVRNEHAGDRILFTALQQEHLHCREQVASQNERITTQNERIAVLENRVKQLEGAIK